MRKLSVYYILFWLIHEFTPTHPQCVQLTVLELAVNVRICNMWPVYSVKMWIIDFQICIPTIMVITFTHLYCQGHDTAGCRASLLNSLLLDACKLFFLIIWIIFTTTVNHSGSADLLRCCCKLIQKMFSNNLQHAVVQMKVQQTAGAQGQYFGNYIIHL